MSKVVLFTNSILKYIIDLKIQRDVNGNFHREKIYYDFLPWFEWLDSALSLT